MEYIKIGIPMLIAVLGWIVVHYLNNKNMRKEKKLVLKFNSYKELKENHKKLISSGIQLINYLNSTVRQLKNYKGSIYEKNQDRDNLIKNYQEEKFRLLMAKYGNVFIEFISEWERNEIIFKPLVKKRYALQIEKMEIDQIKNEIFHEYLLFFSGNINDNSKKDADKLIKKIVLLSERLLDFIACIQDVNEDLQNFVYGDLFKEKIKRRKVLKEESPTIDDLIKKHKEKIESNYIR